MQYCNICGGNMSPHRGKKCVVSPCPWYSFPFLQICISCLRNPFVDRDWHEIHNNHFLAWRKWHTTTGSATLVLPVLTRGRTIGEWLGWCAGMDSVCLILWEGWQMYEFVQYNCIYMYKNQGWEFALSLICSLLFRSKLLILKRE